MYQLDRIWSTVTPLHLIQFHQHSRAGYLEEAEVLSLQCSCLVENQLHTARTRQQQQPSAFIKRISQDTTEIWVILYSRGTSRESECYVQKTEDNDTPPPPPGRSTPPTSFLLRSSTRYLWRVYAWFMCLCLGQSEHIKRTCATIWGNWVPLLILQREILHSKIKHIRTAPAVGLTKLCVQILKWII